MILKAWLEGIPLVRISDVVMRAIKIETLPEKDGYLDLDALITILVPDAAEYAIAIGQHLFSIAPPDDEDESDNMNFDVDELVTAVYTVDESEKVTIDRELWGNYPNEALSDDSDLAGLTNVEHNKCLFFNFFLKRRLHNILAIRQGVRFTYGYGPFLDIFSMDTIRYNLLYQDTIDCNAILEKLIFECDEADEKLLVEFLKEQVRSSLKEIAFYLFKTYAIASANSLTVFYADDTRDELLIFPSCSGTLTINSRIAPTLSTKDFHERLLLCMSDLRYGME